MSENVHPYMIDCYPTMTDDVPHPALLNTWKHHAGWIRTQIVTAAASGVAAVAALPKALAVVGTRLMDLYTGPLSPAHIAEYIFIDLKKHQRFEFRALAEWLATQSEYAMIELPDRSKWTIRLGPSNGRYLHLHPGRWVPHTMRVQANTLRSAVMAHAHARLTHGDPTNLAIINEARELYLGLPPVHELASNGGLGTVIAALS